MSELRWNRWAPLLKTTPSGKILFVCLVCGRSTPAPSDCPKSQLKPGPDSPDAIDPRLSKAANARTCSEIERIINDNIATHLSQDLRRDWAEDKLLPIREALCDSCHGYGCQACLGKGKSW